MPAILYGGIDGPLPAVEIERSQPAWSARHCGHGSAGYLRQFDTHDCGTIDDKRRVSTAVE